MNMSKEDGYAIAAVVVLIALLAALIYAWYTNLLETIVALIVVIVLVLGFGLAIIYFISGTVFFFTKKDKSHEYSSMTLGDVTEVDREMEKK